MAALTGLTPSTVYVVVVRARDGAGNLSTPSGMATFSTQAGNGGSCRVAYTATNWGGGGGFTASITITNTGGSTIIGWTLSFGFTAGQRLTLLGWSATWSQPGAMVTATNLDWNRTLNPDGGNTTIGFNGTLTGTANPAPATFTLNGMTCTAGPNPARGW